jgi:cytochrome c peroxidase
LTAFPRSAARAPDGALSAAATAGKAIFERADVGCASCHAGDRGTDSGFGQDGHPILHDVGSLTAASGQRLGGSLSGLDTPTTRGLSATPPYGHLGQWVDVDAVLDHASAASGKHGNVAQLSSEERAQLRAYLLEAE